MGGNIETVDAQAVESLIGWWRESGVELAVGEAPRGWLLGDAPAPQPASASHAPMAAVTERPTDLAGFQSWLASATGLPMDRAGAVRVPPAGAEQAPLMVMSDLPSREDADAGQNFGGEARILLEKMIRAIGLDPTIAYQASLACFHSPGARIGRDDLAKCAEIARDHIRLAKPERLILFGDGPARALTGEPLVSARGKIHRIEGVRAIATFHPRWLLQRPSDKALAWRDLILLMSESE